MVFHLPPGKDGNQQDTSLRHNFQLHEASECRETEFYGKGPEIVCMVTITNYLAISHSFP